VDKNEREFANLNRKALSEVMHSMPSFDGKVGTYDMEDPADLKEVMTKLKKGDFPQSYFLISYTDFSPLVQLKQNVHQTYLNISLLFFSLLDY